MNRRGCDAGRGGNVISSFLCFGPARPQGWAKTPPAAPFAGVIPVKGDTARLVEYIKSRALPAAEEDDIVVHVA